MKKVNLYLMTHKGFNVLDFLLQSSYAACIKSVIFEKDENILDDASDKIIELCQKENIPCFNRKDKNIPHADYQIAISWRWLISDIKNLIVLHDSLLPKYRGFAPLVNMLINGEKKIGVTAIFASDEYDKGPIITQSSTEIKYPIKIFEAIQIISKNYIEVVDAIFSKICNDEKLTAKEQNENEASYSLWRDDMDYWIDWHQSAERIQNFVNAVSFPYKFASSMMNNTHVKIYEVEVVDDVQIENRKDNIGKVIFMKDNKPVVVCGKGLIKINEMRSLEGKVVILKRFRTRFYSSR